MLADAIACGQGPFHMRASANFPKALSKLHNAYITMSGEAITLRRGIFEWREAALYRHLGAAAEHMALLDVGVSSGRDQL